MTAEGIILQVVIGGLARGGLYALIASGLTLVFGLTRIMNFAHGLFVMLGTYIGLSVIFGTGSFFWALALCPLALGAFGAIVERVLLKPIYKAAPVNQFLLTYGVALIMGQVILLVWGTKVNVIHEPSLLATQFTVYGVSFEVYYLFVIAIAAIVLLTLHLFLRLTNLGMIVRAAIHNREMISAMGVNIDLVYVSVFTVGSAMAGLAGILIGPIFSAYVGLGQDITIIGFIVVIIGGLGSLKGAMVAAIIVGLGEVLSIFIYTPAAPYVVYLLLLGTLLTRPQGLFGSKE